MGFMSVTMSVAHTFRVIFQAKVVSIIGYRYIHAHIRNHINFPAQLEPCHDLDLWVKIRILLMCLCLPDLR